MKRKFNLLIDCEAGEYFLDNGTQLTIEEHRSIWLNEHPTIEYKEVINYLTTKDLESALSTIKRLERENNVVYVDFQTRKRVA